MPDINIDNIENKTRDKQITEVQTHISNIWKTISILTTIFLGILAWIITSQNRTTDAMAELREVNDAKMSVMSASFLDIKSQLSQIQADLIWIKQTLNK